MTQDSFNFNSIKLHSLLTENNNSLYPTANSRFFGWPWYVPFLDRTDVSTIRHPFSFKLSQTYYDCTFLSINKRRSELIQESTTRLDRHWLTGPVSRRVSPQQRRLNNTAPPLPLTYLSPLIAVPRSVPADNKVLCNSQYSANHSISMGKTRVFWSTSYLLPVAVWTMKRFW